MNHKTIGDIMPKSRKGMKAIHVNIPQELFEELKAQAKDLGVTVSQLITMILSSYLRYGIYIPGTEGPRVEIRLSEEDIQRIVEAIKEAQGEKEKKKLLRKLLEWFR